MVDSIETSLADLSDALAISHPFMRILLTIGGAILVQMVSRRIINRLVERAVHTHKHTSHAEEHKREATLKTFFHTSVSVGIWIITVLVCL